MNPFTNAGDYIAFLKWPDIRGSFSYLASEPAEIAAVAYTLTIRDGEGDIMNRIVDVCNMGYKVPRKWLI